MATAEGSDRSPSEAGEPCPLCQGTGVLSWQQPVPAEAMLRTVEMPCPQGCGEHWIHPAAEDDRVIHPVRKQGNAAQADRIGAEFIRRALTNWGFADGEHGRVDRPTGE